MVPDVRIVILYFRRETRKILDAGILFLDTFESFVRMFLIFIFI
jgi:hypothetical protein